MSDHFHSLENFIHYRARAINMKQKIFNDCHICLCNEWHWLSFIGEKYAKQEVLAFF